MLCGDIIRTNIKQAVPKNSKPGVAVSIRHQSFLEFKRYRYLKLAFALLLVLSTLYIWHRNFHFAMPGGTGYGGTPMGYTLGTVAAVLIVWLLWLGVRKRRYRTSRSSLQGWVSAHVYLGVATLFIGLLHSGFEMGLNLHTLTLVLLAIVVISGIYGVLNYVRVPTAMTEKMGDDSLKSLLGQIQTIDLQARKAALQLSDEVNALVLAAARDTRMTGSMFDGVLMRRLRPCPTQIAVDRMQVLAGKLKDEKARAGREVFTLMVSRLAAVQSVRRELQSLAQLKRWLLWHVPVSIALLFALTAHIVSVFTYW